MSIINLGTYLVSMSCLRRYYCRAFSYISNNSRSLNRDKDVTELERRARALRVLDITSSKSSEPSCRQDNLELIDVFSTLLLCST